MKTGDRDGDTGGVGQGRRLGGGSGQGDTGTGVCGGVVDCRPMPDMVGSSPKATKRSTLPSTVNT